MLWSLTEIPFGIEGAPLARRAERYFEPSLEAIIQRDPDVIEVVTIRGSTQIRGSVTEM